jgi:hypothetical protein
MPFDPHDPPYDQLMAAADAVADARPEVDRDIAREVFEEAATLLHNGLVLDALDEHDARAMVAGLCEDLVSGDPGAAMRERARALLASPGDLHDAGAVSDSYLVTAALFGL